MFCKLVLLVHEAKGTSKGGREVGESPGRISRRIAQMSHQVRREGLPDGKMIRINTEMGTTCLQLGFSVPRSRMQG